VAISVGAIIAVAPSASISLRISLTPVVWLTMKNL